MIQRVQTIWLLLAAAAAFLTLKLAFYSGTVADLQAPYNITTHYLTATDNFILMILTSVLGTIIFINIFLFKRRMLQFRMCFLSILIEALILFLYYRQIKLYSQGILAWSAIFHPIIIITLILAARGIYKDEKLIKDSNRLR